MRLSASMFAIALCASGSAAIASVPAQVLQRTQGPVQDPDWPCIQRKVPALSAVAVWTGPPLDQALARWTDDKEVATLVEELSARRTPMDAAGAAIARFAQGLPPETKADRLTLLFAGLFQRLDGERSDVIAGIERYGRKQKEMAEQIRGDMARASDPAVTSSAAQASELQNQLVWKTRIFNERRASLSFVCEVPITIEQRLFQLAKAIAAKVSN